jgi:hypothetical protein
VSQTREPDFPTFSASVIDATKSWLETFVIGLQLCPFARSVYVGGRIHFCVSEEASVSALKRELAQELERLAQADESMHETTLLIHPNVLQDFARYNDFLSEAEATLTELGYEGELQIASFHPQYRFEGTKAGDVENFTNSSPYPMLHLLRESSIDRAIDSHPDVDSIPDNNIRALQALGLDEVRRLARSIGVGSPNINTSMD